VGPGLDQGTGVPVVGGNPGRACGCEDPIPERDRDDAGDLKRQTRHREPNFAAGVVGNDAKEIAELKVISALGQRP
jgi:hypothetical protein